MAVESASLTVILSWKIQVFSWLFRPKTCNCCCDKASARLTWCTAAHAFGQCQAPRPIFSIFLLACHLRGLHTFRWQLTFTCYWNLQAEPLTIFCCNKNFTSLFYGYYFPIDEKVTVTGLIRLHAQVHSSIQLFICFKHHGDCLTSTV